jgi:structural maintenance of chromosome 4
MENMEEKVTALKSELAEKTGEMNQARSKNVELKAKLSADSAALKSLTANLQKYKAELETLKLEMTGFEEMDQEITPLETFSDEELDATNLKKAIGELEKLKTKFSGNSPNLAVLREYRQKMEIYKERSVIVEEAIKKRDEMKVEYDRLRKERLDTFMEGFNAISLKLKEMYQMITLGGNAELELVDSLDPFSEGVLFSVMPPKKSWKNIANLSGGEKTLSSLALVFALHHFKPTPLYAMDEIDAALDFRNVSIIANYIKQRTRNAQFVIISLRNNMFELADRLVGIYKVTYCFNLD